MLDYSIVYGCIVFRLTPASLFKCFPYKRCKVDAFQWFALSEAVYVVLSYMYVRDRRY